MFKGSEFQSRRPAKARSSSLSSQQKERPGHKDICRGAARSEVRFGCRSFFNGAQYLAIESFEVQEYQLELYSKDHREAVKGDHKWCNLRNLNTRLAAVLHTF